MSSDRQFDQDDAISRGLCRGRAGLVGHPSDGYGGAVVSVTLPCFVAEVTASPGPNVHIQSDPLEHRFESMQALLEQTDRFGHVGGAPLLSAAAAALVSHQIDRGVDPARFRRSPTLSYSTDIPRSVGLGGSSALVIATMRALIEFYDLVVPDAVLAGLALQAETRGLGIHAGLQDRVVQSIGGTVAMDFASMREVDGVQAGAYRRVSPVDPLQFYVAWSTAAQPSGRSHSDLRRRWDGGDVELRTTMSELANLAREAPAAIELGDWDRLSELIDRGYDLRTQLMVLHPSHQQLVTVARSTGRSATYTGSGGAIIGLEPSAGSNPSDRLDFIDALAAVDAQVEFFVVQPEGL